MSVEVRWEMSDRFLLFRFALGWGNQSTSETSGQGAPSIEVDHSDWDSPEETQQPIVDAPEESCHGWTVDSMVVSDVLGRTI